MLSPSELRSDSCLAWDGGGPRVGEPSQVLTVFGPSSRERGQEGQEAEGNHGELHARIIGQRSMGWMFSEAGRTSCAAGLVLRWWPSNKGQLSMAKVAASKHPSSRPTQDNSSRKTNGNPVAKVDAGGWGHSQVGKTTTLPRTIILWEEEGRKLVRVKRVDGLFAVCLDRDPRCL